MARSPVGEWQDGAATRAIEVLAAGFDIAGLEIGDINATAPTFVGESGVALRVDEGDEAGDLLVGERKWRHALVDATIANDRSDFVAARIFGDESGASEVGAGLSAAGIAAVTEGAGLLEEGFAVGDGGGGIGLRDHFVVLLGDTGRLRRSGGRSLRL